jgi:Uncharacterized protein conserved in bacteria (DUF2188)
MRRAVCATGVTAIRRVDWGRSIGGVDSRKEDRMGGAVVMALVILLMAGITVYLVGSLARSIGHEKRAQMGLWKNFGLSMGFCALFVLSWIGQGAAQWQEYTDEQRSHNEPIELGDFSAVFSQATLENWQSEFLQLFSFTVMTALLIHKGSAESRDSDDRVEAALKRIEDRLGTTLTLEDPQPLRRGRDLHIVPNGFEGWMLMGEWSAEPEGYYDNQAEAIDSGRHLARRRGVALVIHGDDGKVREQSG